MIKVYGIKTCNSYKKAVKFFQENNIDITTIDLKETVPTLEEIRKYHNQSGLDIKKFFNTSGKLYRELDLKSKYKDMKIDDIYKLLSENGMLIKRPLVVYDDMVLVGFKDETYNQIWKL
ncbi:Spx/MgsR family RNA polymerase-binding regulatory protein [Mycoplasmatota bacterium WC44]